MNKHSASPCHLGPKSLRLAAAAFCTLGVALANTASAQDAPVPVTQQSQQAVSKPTTGQSMDTVETTYGTPIEAVPAVGEPPITRWRYADFTVYFEHDKVIHSVVHRS
ncbi:hypothetical protein FLL45_04090 [Aliikangiella marina]|uniref:Uncharacterized protein n=1 Tax=Aliikangiella marina TaxID=1712262 RepID=A0A545TIT6_9GAMM|nr:hypothetical protein [Aliikangiella marina]TQV77139.1 hypothetical protein FLL45_04090 [Aliikangiella marina]